MKRMKRTLLPILIMLVSYHANAKEAKLTIEWLGWGVVRVIFENRSKERKVFLSPLDGSSEGRFQPHCIFTVWDSRGKEIPYRRTDIAAGIFLEATWPENYLITVEPGETGAILVGINQLMDVEEGKFRIRLKYEYNSSDARPTNGVAYYPSEVWEGTLKSKALRVDARIKIEES